MTFDLDSLNRNQREAVMWKGAPLLVLAGPGSGKTRVLTMRVARILLESAHERFRVLGLTFTNKAAAEMRTRVDEMVSDGRERALLTTFHSFAAEILRQHGSHCGVKPDFVILNEDADREGYLRDAINTLQRKGRDVSESDLRFLPLIDKLLENFAPEDQVEALVADDRIGPKAAEIYGEYRRQLRDTNRLDFPSLLYCAHELLLNAEGVADQIRMVYTHLCVDEFQDTNLAQYRLLRMIVGEKPRNLFVVADDDQIIYQWNGASRERLKELRKDYDMNIIQLPANYRCPSDVIVLANALIRHNIDRTAGKKPLLAVKGPTKGRPVRVLSFNSLDEEVRGVAADILARQEEERRRCVVLARANKLVGLAAQALERAGLQASLLRRKNEFGSAPFKWLHSVLRLANARGDMEQLRRVCKSFYELKGIDIEVEEVVAYASALGGDYLRSWIERAIRRIEAGPESKQFLASVRDLIVDRMDFRGLIQTAMVWFETALSSAGDEAHDVFADFRDEKATWNELQRQVYEKYGPDDVTLQVLLQEFDLTPKLSPVPQDAIGCLTIASSKGLEFGHVYVIGMVEDQLPSFHSVKEGPMSREMQEERRNCFVAITRAESTLTLTYSHSYFGWPKEPSRFLREMGLIG